MTQMDYKDTWVIKNLKDLLVLAEINAHDLAQFIDEPDDVIEGIIDGTASVSRKQYLLIKYALDIPRGTYSYKTPDEIIYGLRFPNKYYKLSMKKRMVEEK